MESQICIKSYKEDNFGMKEKDDMQLKEISISCELYDLLRRFCDEVGIAFADFVEDALESATRRHELEEMLNNEADLKERLLHERQSAYLSGYDKGVLVALLQSTGRLGVASKLVPTEVKEQPRFEAVTGGQMKLF